MGQVEIRLAVGSHSAPAPWVGYNRRDNSLGRYALIGSEHRGSPHLQQTPHLKALANTWALFY